MGLIVRQRDVEPGDVTGIYHITVCSLPFDCSWRQLKDYVCSACDVDHVEVFRSSTSGWVRLKGEDNFHKAWNLLNGGCFNGRAIIASDRNKTERIKIKECIEAGFVSAASSHAPNRFQSAQSSQSSSMQLPAAFTSPGQASDLPYVDQWQLPALTTQGYMFQGHLGHDWADFSFPLPVDGYYGTAPSSVLDYPGGHYPENYAIEITEDHVPAAPPGLGVDAWLSFTAPLQPPPPPPLTPSPFFLLTEPRKVIVAQLPPKARVEEVQDWISKRCEHLLPILFINVPCRPDTGELRGNAFIDFATTESAQSSLKVLDDVEFQGRRVSAKIANEGLSQYSRCQPPPVRPPPAQPPPVQSKKSQPKRWQPKRWQPRRPEPKQLGDIVRRFYQYKDAQEEQTAGRVIILPHRPGTYAFSDVCPHDRDEDGSEAETLQGDEDEGDARPVKMTRSKTC